MPSGNPIMQCSELRPNLNSLVDNELDADTTDALLRHAAECGECGPLVTDSRELKALLAEYPAPQAPPGFYDRAIARAILRGGRSERRRWILTGFGSAVAAGLAIWLLGAVFFATPPARVPGLDIPGITMTMAEPRTVNLMFASEQRLATARLTLMLPEGVELAGFPGQREISWETSLNPGKNLLPLTLIARSAAGGEILARLEHDDRTRTFRLRVDVS